MKISTIHSKAAVTSYKLQVAGYGKPILETCNLKLVTLILCASLCTSVLFAQGGKYILKNGNDSYKEGNFESAQEQYEQSKALEAPADIADFNLGDALYRQGKFEEAAGQFGKVAQTSDDTELKASAYHNMGNSYLSQQDWAKALDSYKKSLRLDPNSEECRYNLAYARKMIQKEQEQQQQDQENQDQENQDDQEKQEGENEDQEKQEGDQEKDDGQGEENQDPGDEEKGDEDQEGEGENKDDQNQDGQQDEGEGEEGQDGEEQKENEGQGGDQQEQEMPIPNQISKEDAARILNALDKAEEDIQHKLRKHKGTGKKVKIEKDW